MGPHETLSTTLSADSMAETGKIIADPPQPAAKCDFNADGLCDDSDTEAVSALWNTCAGEEGYDPFFDLDDDGCVTVLDIMRVVNGQ